MSYAALPILLVLLRLRLILYPMDGYLAINQSGEFSHTPLYESCFGGLDNGSVWSIVTALVVTFFTTMLVNNLSNRFHITDKQSTLVGMFYVILSSSFVISSGMDPVLIFAFCLSLSMYHLFAGTKDQKPMESVFMAAIILSVGCMLWSKGIIFIPMYIFMMIVLRRANMRCMLAMMMGMLVPVMIYGTWQFYNDRLEITIVRYIRTISEHVLNYSAGKLSWSYIAMIAIIAVMAILSGVGNMLKMGIVESRYMRIIVWLAGYSGLILFTFYYSLETLQVMAVSLSILAAVMLEKWRSAMWQELSVVLFTAVTVVVQWKIKGMLPIE